MLLVCIVCKSETDKYKCPKCSEYYCSLKCFKEHKKEECSQKPLEIEVEEPRETLTHMPFKTEDTVDVKKLKDLGQSKELKNLLNNPHLRNLLKEIDEAPSAWNAMKVAMQEPLFIEFADECLKIVEPIQENSD